MFEAELKKISEEIFNNENLSEYFILTHKKHGREMYFKSGSVEALVFAKPKFNSIKKWIIFSLLKLKILQPFLKKIRLSENIGEVILVGEQIKGIDLKNKIVNSFLHLPRTEEKFTSNKKFQNKFGELGFAPKIIKLDDRGKHFQEELLEHYTGDSSKIFERLLKFYSSSTIEKTSLLKFETLLDRNKLKGKLFSDALSKIKKIDYFLFARIHGEFAREQCLAKNGKIYFIDWDIRNGLFTEDIINFYRGEDDILNNDEFRCIIKNYPPHVNKHLKEYLLATELLRVSSGIGDLEESKKRIANLIK